MINPWKLTAMEECGCVDTSEGCINRVARYLAQSPNDVIEAEEFRCACQTCGVNPDSFSQKDLKSLQAKLDRLT